jgi:hypothetical protein
MKSKKQSIKGSKQLHSKGSKQSFEEIKKAKSYGVLGDVVKLYSKVDSFKDTKVLGDVVK